MGVAPTFKLRTEGFNAYLRELNKHTKGVSFKRVVEGECGAIMATAASRTKAADPKKITVRYKINERSGPPPRPWEKRRRNKKGQFTSRPGPKGQRTGQNEKLVDAIEVDGRLHYTSNYYPQQIWSKVKKALKEKEKEKKKLRMSGRATWYLIAKKAKCPTRTFKTLAGIQKAIKAQNAKFKSDKVENGTPIKRTFSFAIRVDNKSTACLNRNARGSHAIRSAMAGRPKSMKGNVKRGVFQDAKKRAQQYKNIYVTDKG